MLLAQRLTDDIGINIIVQQEGQTEHYACTQLTPTFPRSALMQEM